MYSFTGEYSLRVSPQHREAVVFKNALKNEKAFLVSFRGFFEQYIYEESQFAVLKIIFYKSGNVLKDKIATLHNLTGNETISSEADYFGKAHTWYPVQLYFSVPEEADSVKISFHCRGGTNYNVDDLTVKTTGAF
jgi:hypothetical protein